MNQEPRIPKVAPRRNRQNNGKQLSQEYLEYMESDAWRDLRNRKYTENGYRCQACGVKYNDTSCLEVHHTHYDNLTFEDTSDLLVLCHLCHDVIGLVRDMRKTQYRIVDPHIKAARLEASLELDHIEDFILRFDPYLKEEGQRWDLFKEYRTKIAEYYDSIGWDASGPTLGLEYHSFLYSEEDPKVNELTRLFAPLVSVESKDDDEETTVEKQEEPRFSINSQADQKNGVDAGWLEALEILKVQKRSLYAHFKETKLLLPLLSEGEPDIFQIVCERPATIKMVNDNDKLVISDILKSLFGIRRQIQLVLMDSDKRFHDLSSLSISGDVDEKVFDDYLEGVFERIREEVDRNPHRFGKIGRNRLSDIALGENGVDIDAEELFNLIKSLKTESGEVLGT
ncbi:TPA: hypothetical protein EYO77_19040, partial [Candidatus Poribacteria bacterium]|nr:hypothetical protein [Candidatus Poribacteria bacterium]